FLKKFDFANVKTASTPVETQKPLVKDEEASDVDVHLYRSMIGSLMYLTASRPDIMFAVCACSRFQVTLKSSYLSTVKRIFRHHFIRDAYEKKLIQVLKIHTDDNVAYLLTKAFDGKHFSGKVTPLFATMLVLPTQDEGASSERPSEALPTPSPAPTSEVPYEPQIDSSLAQTSEVPLEHQTDLSPRPSPTTTILDSIPEASGENLGGHSSSNKSLSGNEGELTLQTVYNLCLSLCAQSMDAKYLLKAKIGKKEILKETIVQRDPLFDEIPEDTLDNMETEDAQDVGRTRDEVDEEKENDEDVLSTAQEKVSTDKEKVSTNKEKVSTD
ncbi:hypothetical protein Tco_1350197, partial [Tanacetum coccineum]